MAVLEAIALAKLYGSVPAVREVTFRLEPGQVLGYLGPNGSGKSTTEKVLTGLDVTSVLIIKNLIRALSARGKAVFYCSHILEVVEKLCSQLLILRNGQVIAYGSTEEVRQRIGQSSLERIFLQLVEDKDVAQVANEIVDVVVSPS